MFCTNCGTENNDNNYRCTQCGQVLARPAPAAVGVESDGTLGGLIPTKNPKSLWSYYMGIFSIIPFIGIPLGIAALVLGVQALGHSNKNPESKGKVHAWVGIICGGLFALLYFVALLAIIGAAVSQARPG